MKLDHTEELFGFPVLGVCAEHVLKPVFYAFEKFGLGFFPVLNILKAGKIIVRVLLVVVYA